MKRRPRPAWRKLQFLLRFKLTPVGWMAVFVMFLSAIGLITIEIPVYQMMCGIVALFGVAEFTGTMLRPRLKVTGTFPERVSAGETALGLFTLENIGYLPACDLMCTTFGLPTGIRQVNAEHVIRTLPRGQRASLPVTLQVDQRGEYLIPEMFVHSTFPINLMRFGAIRIPARKLMAVPAFHHLEQIDIPISHRYQQGGMLLESRSGNAAEYVGNREYIPGEPTKRLDFRAWARAGKPVVREYQDEFCSRVALLLDTHLQSRFPWFPKDAVEGFEAAVSLTAAIADALDHLGTTLDLFAAGPDLFLFQSAGPEVSHLDAVLEILAAVEPTRHNPFDKVSPALSDTLESTSIVICLFVDWDATREELVNRIIQSGCALRVFLVRERPSTAPFPEDEYYTQVRPRDILEGAVCSL